MEKNFQQIINESIKRTLLEMDLVPTDNQGETNLTRNKALNYWRMIYRLMDNVKTAMDSTYQGKGSAISMKDVNNIIEYINMSIKNIVK